MIKFLLAAAMGAAVAYFLDPDQGKRRRAIARDRTMATIRRAANQAGKKAQYAASTAQGLTNKVAHGGGDGTVLDDATLAHKVESELFRDPNIPKGKINVNAENGVVVLRGQLDEPRQIDELEKRVRQIEGVYDVENLLHLPNSTMQA